MWKKLERWQRSVVVLAVFYASLYTIGRMFVSIDTIDYVENYKWPPLLYSMFMVLPVLLIRYSRRTIVRWAAGGILVLFMLVIIVPTALHWNEFYGNCLRSSGNTFVALVSVFYVAPLIGGFLALMMILGGIM